MYFFNLSINVFHNCCFFKVCLWYLTKLYLLWSLRLQAAALNQLEVVKERSVTGLQAAIDNHSVLDLNIAIAASHVIVPENGVYSK